MKTETIDFMKKLVNNLTLEELEAMKKCIELNINWQKKVKSDCLK